MPSESETTLKPCPLCGREPDVRSGDTDGEWFTVECDQWGAEHKVVVHGSGSAEEGIAIWNKRYTEHQYADESVADE